MSFDVIVIGGGHNGLAAALRLSLAGKKVAVFEKNEFLGGLAAPHEFHPGYSTQGILHDSDAVRPAIVDALGLQKHGLKMASGDAGLLAAEPGGKGVMIYRDPGHAGNELSDLDATGYRQWRAFLGRVRGFVSAILDQPPPALNAGSPYEIWELAKSGLSLRRLGRSDMTELLRVMPMSVADWVRESIESPRVCAALAAPAVISTWCGPHSAGTSANLLFHECVAGAGVEGGPAALVAALVKACQTTGVNLRCNARVESINIDRGVVKGVTLADGESVAASVVASAVGPKYTFIDLIHPSALDMRIEDQFRVIRTRGTTAKVHLALDGPIVFSGRQGQTITRARTGNELDDLERAFDAVKYRRSSDVPHLDVRVTGDSNKPVVSIIASYAPHDLEGGWTDAATTGFGDKVVDVLEAHAPGVKDRVVGREVLTPADFETQFSLTGGQLHQGEHGLDQLLFMRPAPCAARYETPISGLFLCGAGSHPGGGITAAPGMIAAGVIAAAKG